jgi:hypothetical protein
MRIPENCPDLSWWSMSDKRLGDLERRVSCRLFAGNKNKDPLEWNALRRG